MTDVIRSAYLKTLEVEEEEAGREEVVLHTYDFHPEEFRVPEGLRVPEELRVPTVDPPGGLRPKSLRSESAVVQ